MPLHQNHSFRIRFVHFYIIYLFLSKVKSCHKKSTLAGVLFLSSEWNYLLASSIATATCCLSRTEAFAWYAMICFCMPTATMSDWWKRQGSLHTLSSILPKTERWFVAKPQIIKANLSIWKFIATDVSPATAWTKATFPFIPSISFPLIDDTRNRRIPNGCSGSFIKNGDVTREPRKWCVHFFFEQKFLKKGTGKTFFQKGFPRVNHNWLSPLLILL